MDSYPRTTAIQLLGLLLALALSAAAIAQPVAVTVKEPYLELHTGPGRGYPVFYAVERGAAVELLQRRTDWYQVRAGRRATGWVHRDQLERTLADVDPGLRAAVLDRALTNALSVGLGAGALDDDPLLRMQLGYRIDDKFDVELGIGQIAGTYSSSRIYELGALYRPWPERKLLPHLTLSVGYFENAPRSSLVDANDTDGELYSVGIGLSRRIEEHISLRADYRFRHADFDSGSDEFHEFTAGLVLHF